MKKQTSNSPPRVQKTIFKWCSIICSISLIICFLSGCNITRNIEPVSRQSIYFDTSISITLYEYEGSSDTYLDECMEMCSQYEKLFSATYEGSDIWNINHSNGEEVFINSETGKLLEKALYYCELSQGAVDVTLGSLSSLWDFSNNAGKSTSSPPSKELIDEALGHVSYENVQLSCKDGQYSVKLSDIKSNLELGFIAKGYIADSLAQYLSDNGVTSAIINLGGNVKCIGSKTNNIPFSIGIQKPFDKQGEYIILVPCENTSLVSSGVYERYYYYNDTLYHHILDSHTGYPIENNLLSVTIKTDSATDADALSTLCFILGTDDGLKLIESLPDTEAVFITNDYELVYSSGF